MIRLGYSNDEKRDVITEYVRNNGIKKVFMISPEEFTFSYPNIDYVSYNNSIRYSYFYRLLQEIDSSSLLVLNECMRTKKRNDLTYNCIRHFLNQTKHQIIFQYLPIIDSIQDFMILFDFDTQTRYKGYKFNPKLIEESDIKCKIKNIELDEVEVFTSKETKIRYAKEKKKAFDNLEQKDPHTLPRNLYLIAGRDKLDYADLSKVYIARNRRLNRGNVINIRDAVFMESPEYGILEYPHNHIVFTDFLFKTKQTKFDVLVGETKADIWYRDRYNEWNNELKKTYEEICK